MKFTHLLKTAVVSVATLTSVLAASAAEFDFKLHHMLSALAPAHSKMLEPWARQVEKNSGGRVKIELFPSMTLGGRPAELVGQARDGVVDIIWTVNGYTPGVFQRTEVFELPTVYKNDPVATNLAMAEMFDEFLAVEYKGLKPLFLHVHAGQGLQMVDKEIRKPADLAGLRMRIPTRTGSWVIEALGASPISIPIPDLPPSLAKKVIDGAFIPWEIITPLKLQDQTQYQIELADKERLGTTTFQVSMNGERWDSLPDDIKAAFTDASGEEWLKEVGEIWRSADNHGIDVAVKSGNTHITLSEEESVLFRDALKPVVDRWIAEVASKGIDGQALVDRARELIAKHGTK